MPSIRAKPRVLARDRIRIIADETGLEEKFVRQVIIRLKTDGRIATSRPIAPELTASDLARIVIALAASLPSRATEIEQRIGKMPRASGFGAETAIDELANIIRIAARRDGSIDFRHGDILIGVNHPSASVHIRFFTGETKAATYRDDTHYSGVASYVMYPLNVVSRLARQLIEV